MTPKRQRMWFIGISVLVLCAAGLMVMQAFRDNIVFFRTPGELLSTPSLKGQFVRIGGLVVPGTVENPNESSHRFHLSDGANELIIEYQGLLPALFREGQGVVAEGRLDDGNHFKAERILAKHDENYLPSEVVDSLKQSGHWRKLPPAAGGPMPDEAQ